MHWMFCQSQLILGEQYMFSVSIGIVIASCNNIKNIIIKRIQGIRACTCIHMHYRYT